MNARLPSTRITNAFTCDVEDYFQVSALAPHFPRGQWDSVPCRIERNVDRILELLDGHEAQGTFFTLGWIAERYPGLVRRIADNGHEVASHGYGHERACAMTPQAFTADIKLAKAVLKDIGTLAGAGCILLYLDESQYLNKKQQQSLLECIEDGSVTLIASTTENPYFYIYNALLSERRSGLPSAMP